MVHGYSARCELAGGPRRADRHAGRNASAGAAAGGRRPGRRGTRGGPRRAVLDAGPARRAARGAHQPAPPHRERRDAGDHPQPPDPRGRPAGPRRARLAAERGFPRGVPVGQAAASAGQPGVRPAAQGRAARMAASPGRPGIRRPGAQPGRLGQPPLAHQLRMGTPAARDRVAGHRAPLRPAEDRRPPRPRFPRPAGHPAGTVRRADPGDRAAAGVRHAGPDQRMAHPRPGPHHGADRAGPRGGRPETPPGRPAASRTARARPRLGRPKASRSAGSGTPASWR